MITKEKHEIIIEAIAVLLGDCEIIRKRAAILLLKALIPHSVLRDILNEDGIYPFKRDDPKVRRWTKAVLGRGRCERCGATEHLEAHHIIKWADYPKGRADTNNGECLCHKCHTDEHIDDPSYYMMKAGRGKRK
jgi:hypothetical protein